MAWKRFFTQTSSNSSPLSGSGSSGNPTQSATGNFSSFLPEVYAGAPNRIERYGQYEDMDKSDPVVNAALNVVAEFCTQDNNHTNLPFSIKFKEDATDSEKKTLEETLKKWCYINDFKTRMFYIVRKVLVYGDCIFVRDPETFEWEYVDPKNVDKVIVDELKGKDPEAYFIRDLDLNLTSKVMTTQKNSGESFVPGGIPTGGTANYPGQPTTRQATSTSRFTKGSHTEEVAGEHIVHLSLNTGMEAFWPFGNSILEPVFKAYKQKQLLEDSIVIYRVQRSPERRVFKIHTGTLPSHKAMAYVERVKNEIQQRRIPSRTGGGSQIMDAAYNPLCLSLDTKIPLLDGRTLELNELIKEYKEGKENWVYSCDPITGKIVPGNITWAGVTRKDTQVIRLTLDNGETLVVTPDHKIPLLGKGFVEAQDIKINEDSLISFETRLKGVATSSADRTYTQVFDHEDKNWKFTHRMVANFFKDINKHQEFTFLPENAEKEKNTIHHKDYNRYNNDPRNLQFMNKEDHLAWHVHTKKEYWENISDIERERITSKISNTLKDYFAAFTEEEKKEFSDFCSVRSKKVHSEMKENDPDHYQDWRDNCGKARAKYLENNPEEKKKLIENNLLPYVIPSKNQEIKFTQDMLNRAMTLINFNDWNRLETMAGLAQDEQFMIMFREANKPEESSESLRNFCKISTDKITDKSIKKLVKTLGYKDWWDLKEKSKVYNHKVVKIEWLNEKIDTGTITVDGKERWHTHHTFAISAGIFVKNSILEDYYFPVNSEGQGSTVDILPGGADLSMINDVLYFNNQLIRGMGIPSSYLPTGPEDSQTVYSDGKMGQAFMQELRFSNFCKRIQNILINNFDYEFKLFCKHSGIVVESSQYEIVMEEPESFGEYRQIEKDAAHANVTAQYLSIPTFSKRFVLKRFAGLSEAEILENERLWREENKSKLKGAAKFIDNGQDASAVSLRNVGIPEPPPAPENFDDALNTEEEPAPTEGEAPMGQTASIPAPPEGT